MEELGRSVEGRAITHVWLGKGPMHVLLWSQMHGDESTATSSLLDILEYVARHRSEPSIERLLSRLTLHLVPMLNPDGARRFQRRNAQGIDINRDALLLQSPEGRILKALRDRLQPALGFNLHNQNWRTAVGKTRKPASISLLAVAFDEPRSESPGRTLAKKTCAVLRDTFESFVPGQVARYDDEFEVRAFGDNLTKWGTPVVLIETGPLGGPSPDLDLVRLNFVGIFTALDALASGTVEKAEAARYETLPMNDGELFTLIVRNASIVVGAGIQPFTGDVGLVSSRVVRPTADGGDSRELTQLFRVEDLGDLRVYSAIDTIDGTGMYLAPNAGWTEGAELTVPDWKEFASPKPLAVGASIDLALLRPTSAGHYKVMRILPAQRVIK